MSFLLILFISAGAFGQTGNSTLGGTVQDASGALIPGVEVTATNTGTGIVSTVISNESGAYQFASLQPGAYTVSAALPGFQSQTYNNVALGGSQQVRLNFNLKVGNVAQAVEVTINADTLIATTSASVGTALGEQKVRDLPLGSRNVLDLLSTTAGAGPTNGDIDGYFAGGRVSAVNVTRDGFSVTNGRYAQGTYAATYVSPDLVEEVRVITATVDAEAGRGAGQVQMVTRSGTNQYRGSLFLTNRNSALDASNYFNNLNSAPKDWENRNQFGARLGGPIIKNKTFFFVLLEEQRDVVKQTFVGTTLTEQARNGTFRFFPGADNANATQNNPTVDLNGNPVRPLTATGDLQSFSVFGRDPNRLSYDPSGFVQAVLLSRMPLPNDYTAGDGLNTAGIRFTRRISGQDLANGNSYDQNNRDQLNLRLDHNFNSNNKASFIYTWERALNHSTQAGIQQWPGGYDGQNSKWPRIYTGSLVSTLSQSVVNEARVGLRRTAISSWAPFYVGRKDQGEPDDDGKKALALLPVNNGIPFQPVTTLFAQNFMNWSAGDGSTRGSISPLWTYGDTISWSKGRHALKAGGEYRRDRSKGWNDSNITPQALLGAGGVPVAIDNTGATGITGLSNNNLTLARNLLTDLSGSVASIREGFDLVTSKDLTFRGYADGQKLRFRAFNSNEFSAFFKDDWKIKSSVTLNLGIHWEWFGVPYESNGLAGRPVGAAAGLCGISCGSLTTVELVGKHSPNPGKQLYKDDWNNFAPSFGLSWSLPYLGKDRTVLRAGYGWSYTGRALADVVGGLNAVVGAVPGASELNGTLGLSYTQAGYLNLANLKLPIPHQFTPLRPSPLDGSRADVMQAFIEDRVNPYVQNFNLELQHEFARDLSISVAYVGSKGTKLYNAVPLNYQNIYAKGPTGQTFLEAFNITRSGGDAVLFDQLLNGMTIPGTTGAVNGASVRGSAALRAYTNTRAFIANGSVGALANFLNTSTNITGSGGGFIRNSGLFPENFLVLNPQFATVTRHENAGNSIYHSMQLQATKRLSHGLTSQTSWTWSRAIGISDGEGVINARDPRNISLDRMILGYHRTHNISSNGTFELPFGQGRAFLASAPGWMQRLTERWQLGGLLSWVSGAPLTITTATSSIWNGTNLTTPDMIGGVPEAKVTRLNGSVTLFPGIQQIADASARNTVSSNNGLQSGFSNKSIADASGTILLINPAPGEPGTLGKNVVYGPTRLSFDANLIKTIRLTESKNFVFRVDVVNVLNHVNFDVPVANALEINNASFGRITTADSARRFTLSARLNF